MIYTERLSGVSLLFLVGICYVAWSWWDTPGNAMRDGIMLNLEPFLSQIR